MLEQRELIRRRRPSKARTEVAAVYATYPPKSRLSRFTTSAYLLQQTIVSITLASPHIYWFIYWLQSKAPIILWQQRHYVLATCAHHDRNPTKRSASSTVILLVRPIRNPSCADRNCSFLGNLIGKLKKEAAVTDRFAVGTWTEKYKYCRSFR